MYALTNTTKPYFAMIILVQSYLILCTDAKSSVHIQLT